MEASAIALLLGTVLGGGGLVAAILSWRKFPQEKDASTVDQAKATAEIAVTTLTTVNEQYKEVMTRTSELERKVNDITVQLQEQKNYVSKLKDYIIDLFDNWEAIRHNPNPPKLTTDIRTQIFKEVDE